MNTKDSETHTPRLVISGFLGKLQPPRMAHASEHSRGWKLDFPGGGVGRADPQPETRLGPTLGEAQGVPRETCFSTWKTTGSREVGTWSHLPDALDRAALCKKPLPPRPCSAPPSADDLGLGIPFLPFILGKLCHLCPAESCPLFRLLLTSGRLRGQPSHFAGKETESGRVTRLTRTRPRASKN